MRFIGRGMREEVSDCGIGGTLTGSLVTEIMYGLEGIAVSETSTEAKDGAIAGMMVTPCCITGGGACWGFSNTEENLWT